MMQIQTEPIGSIPRSPELIAAFRDKQTGRMPAAEFERIAERELEDTIRRFEWHLEPLVYNSVTQIRGKWAR